jgi:hypothetical protein
MMPLRQKVIMGRAELQIGGASHRLAGKDEFQWLERISAVESD